MCVYKLRHGHLKTACLPTAVLSNSSEMCVCVYEQVESFLPEAAAEKKNLCQRVSGQTSLTHKSTISERLKHSPVL